MNELENSFLVYLYEGHFTRTYDSVNWREWGEEKGLSGDESDNLYYRLQRAGLVDAASLGPFAEITVRGILTVENEALGAAELVTEQQTIRHKLLIELDRIMREDGPQYFGSFDEMVLDLDMDRETAGLNIELLCSLGYAEREGIFLFRISRLGESTVASHMLKVDLAARFRALEDLADKSKRGHDLEDLISELADRQGFVVVPRARSLGEENDVMLSLASEHWLVSCKWEAGPAKSAYVDEVRIRVAKRPGTVGVLVSMSGFSREAVAEAASNTSLGLVLLISKADVDVLFTGEEALLEMLREKRRVLVSYRQAVFRPEEDGS